MPRRRMRAQRLGVPPKVECSHCGEKVSLGNWCTSCGTRLDLRHAANLGHKQAPAGFTLNSRVLGGYGHLFRPNESCAVTFSQETITVLSRRGGNRLTLEIADLSNIELAGGARPVSADTSGSGPPLDARATGAVGTTGLAAPTTLRDAETVIGMQWDDGELILLAQQREPELRIELSHVFGAVRHRHQRFASSSAGIGGELERLADLFVRGLLTETEFIAAKAKLIARTE